MTSNKYTTVAHGFTLIEVLIVLTILSILSTVMLVDFSSSRVDQEVEGSAREVASAFREAQNYALTGYQGVTNTDPCRFDVAWGGSTYSITYYYKNGAGSCTLSTVLRTYALRSGVVFTGSGSYYFTLPHAAMSFAGASLPVTLSKAGTSYTICSYATGLINHYIGSACP